MGYYESLGELDIGVNCLSPFAAGWNPNSQGSENYSHTLDVMTGIDTLQWTENGTQFKREMFISRQDKCLCFKYTCNKPEGLTISLQYDKANIYEGTVPDPRRPGKTIRAGGWGSMFL